MKRLKNLKRAFLVGKVFFSTIIFGLILLTTSSANAEGNIHGDFELIFEKTGSSYPAADFQVFILDAVNAELLFPNPLYTDSNGTLNTGPIPAGTYKLAVLGSMEITLLGSSVCITSQSYIGPDKLLLFDSGETFTVEDDKTTNIAYQFPGRVCEIKEIVETDPFLLTINVVDSVTKDPIEGMSVKALDQYDAFPNGWTCTTDFSGNCVASGKGDYYLSAKWGEAKLRFFDPTGKYLPEFYGAGSDNFSLGQVVKLSRDSKNNYTMEMSQKTVQSIVTDMVGDIKNLYLDVKIQDAMVGTLNRALGFVEDKNPNNDQAACGAFKGFINQINGRVNSGQISEYDAFLLTTNAKEAQTTIGCD